MKVRNLPMNLERWLRETGKWIEETGKPLGSWIEETGHRLNPEDRSGVSEDGAQDWSRQVSQWGSHFTDRLREWSSDPGRALEDFDKLGGQIQEEWSEMAEWLHEKACDGFNVMFPYLPGGLDDFVDQVVPELQRRGIFRREYKGRTLRDHLGLPRPANRFFGP